jgi:hypothetical protein
VANCRVKPVAYTEKIDTPVDYRYLRMTVNAGRVLVDAKLTMGYSAGALCDVYFLIVGALPEGDVNVASQVLPSESKSQQRNC